MTNALQDEAVVVGIDPGQRIGVAWVGGEGQALALRVVSAAELASIAFPAGARVVLGDGTGSAALRELLAARGVAAALIDERGSSEEGRALYWATHPPRGWRRWLPRGLLGPPAELDAYAAWVIARRGLGGPGGDGSEPRSGRT